MRAAEPERRRGGSACGRCRSVSGSGNWRSSKFAPRTRAAPCRPRRCAPRAARCRRRPCGGSAGPASPSAGSRRRRCPHSDGSASSRCEQLGALEQGVQADRQRVRVVSLPATVSSRNITSNSRSLEPRAVDLGLDQLVTMSSRGSARRCSASRARRRTSRAPPGSRTAGGRTRRRPRGRRPGRRDLLGVGVAEHPVADRDQQPAVLGRRPEQLGEDPHRDLHRDLVHEVQLVAGERVGQHAPGEVADPLLVGVDDLGVNPLLTMARSRVWAGGSMSSIDLRASICSGVRSCSDVPPSSEEYLRQSFEAATTSA